MVSHPADLIDGAHRERGWVLAAAVDHPVGQVLIMLGAVAEGPRLGVHPPHVALPLRLGEGGELAPGERLMWRVRVIGVEGDELASMTFLNTVR